MKGKGVLAALKFNATVYMKFRVCETLAKYENDMLSLCETTNVFIDSFFVIQKSIFISWDHLKLKQS